MTQKFDFIQSFAQTKKQGFKMRKCTKDLFRKSDGNVLTINFQDF